ncbi:uncharacterized protein LOC116429425 [Nomia melanderi]|uniref:uncharacterized protein LOC116429425 n=1 Tax=Nomia melanderi TaxID=2448451 RepID=UPI003FCEA4F9
MDGSKYVEVTITDPDVEVPVSDTQHIHSALSTIQEYDNSNIPQLSLVNLFPGHVQNSKSFKSDDIFSKSSEENKISIQPFDIDLLLRYYACNSSMEKSINKMFEATGDRVCKDVDRGSLVELGAVYRVFNLLQRESFGNILSFVTPFRDAAIKLQSLLRRYSNNELEQIFASDPSIKICKYCGVISCSNKTSESIGSRRSPPRTSYFLNTQTLSDNTNRNNGSELCRATEKFDTQKPLSTKRIGKYYNSRKNITSGYKRLDNRRSDNSTDRSSTDKHDDKIPSQQVEIMIAEREDVADTAKSVQNVASEQISENKKTLRNQMSSLQRSEPSSIKAEKFTVENCNVADDTEKKLNENDAMVARVADVTTSVYAELFKLHNNKDLTSLVDDSVSRKKRTHEPVIRSQRSIDETSEKFVKDILYEQSGTDDSNFKIDKQHKNIQGAKDSHEVDSIINTMTYLAHSRLGSADTKQDEFVSQLNDRARIKSRASNNRRRFILHASRDCNPQLDSAFDMHNELKNSGGGVRGNKCENFEHLSRSNEQSTSLSCLMEDDSLENISRAFSPPVNSDQSVSSSSAENMIREWMKCPRTKSESSSRIDNCGITVSSTPLIIGLDVKLQTPGTNDKCVYCTQTSIDKHVLQHKDSTGTRVKDALLSSNVQKDNELSTAQVSQVTSENSRHDISQDSISDNVKKRRSKGSLGSKKFSIKQILGSLKPMKLKQSKTNSKFSTLSEKNSSNGSIKNVTRRISYNESFLKSLIKDDEECDEVADTLLLYRKILEGTEEMDWEDFQRFIEKLHSSQKDLWRDICSAINNEAKRLADKGDGTTEVCIEISSVHCKGTKQGERSCGNEIVFEMDMTLGDLERFLDRKLASTKKRQLDTFRRASEVIRVRNDDVCDTKVVSNQAE